MAQKPAPNKSVLGNFAIGGAAGIFAMTLIMPVDIVKVRIQILSGENPGKNFTPLGVARNVFAEGGMKSFFTGYDSAVARQCFYTTSRFGIFYNLTSYLKESQNVDNLPFSQKLFASLAAGGLGSFLACPCDCILVRMQADSMLEESQRRNYKSFFDAFRRIPVEEGVRGLWSGAVPTMTRAMALNGTLFSTYEEFKERIFKATGNTTLSWYSASFFAGGLAAFTSLPFDNAKTKLQKQVPDAEGKMLYKNIFHCMQKEVALNGAAGMWAGFPTYTLKTIPQNMMVLIAADNLRKFFGYI